MGFLGTRAGPLADLCLIISITAFIILILGVAYAKRKALPMHFKLARLAVLLLIIVFAWMGSRFIGAFHLIVSHLTGIPSLVTLSHAIIGALALTSGIFLAFDMVIKKTRSHMKTVLLLWILTLLFGIGLYFLRYVLMPFPSRSWVKSNSFWKLRVIERLI